MNANMLRGPLLPSLIAIGVVAASVAGTVALTGNHHASSGSATPTPAAPPPVRNAAWVVDGAQDASTLSELTGFWIGSDVVVRGGIDGLHAMKRSDGTAAWDLPTPGGGDVCGMSPGIDNGVGIVVAQGTAATLKGGSASCSVVSGIDVASGKVLWTKPISGAFGDPAAGAADSAAVGGMAVIDSDQSGTEVGIVALDVKTGAEKWKHPGDCAHLPHSFATANGRVAIAEVCQNQPQATVRVLDAATGAAVPDAAVPKVPGQPRPFIVTADPVVVADDGDHAKKLTFGAGAPVAVSGIDGLFDSPSKAQASRAQVSVGGGVLCASEPTPVCWGAAGQPLVPHGLPNAGADHHDAYPVVGAADAARLVTVGVPTHPRASLCRIAPNGGVVIEADLSQPVSDYLGQNGIAAPYAVYADAKDLFVVDPHPNGRPAVIDVRLG